MSGWNSLLDRIGKAMAGKSAFPIEGNLQVNDADVDSANPVPTQLTGSKAEQESAQHTELATAVKEYALAEGAKQIEIYCESGAVRIRTDGEPCTATTGIPLAADYAVAFEVDSVSVYYVQESVITVVSR